MISFFLAFIEGLKQTTAIEAIAVLSGIVYVLLAARNNIWCWPASMISVVAYIFICFESKLYFETLLQFYYFAATIYGWKMWQKQVDHESLPISYLPLKHHFILIGIGGIATLIFAFVANNYTQAALPFVDAFTTIFALIATWMVTKRIIENWIYWIIIDAVSFFLYSSRTLQLTALLFLLYVFIAVFGFINWRKLYKAQTV